MKNRKQNKKTTTTTSSWTRRHDRGCVVPPPTPTYDIDHVLDVIVHRDKIRAKKKTNNQQQEQCEVKSSCFVLIWIHFAGDLLTFLIYLTLVDLTVLLVERIRPLATIRFGVGSIVGFAIIQIGTVSATVALTANSTGNDLVSAMSRQMSIFQLT